MKKRFYQKVTKHSTQICAQIRADKKQTDFFYFFVISASFSACHIPNLVIRDSYHQEFIVLGNSVKIQSVDDVPKIE